ncbi:MAG: 3-isopropylmalate dehydratase small subunit [Candidatus Omnitrophota bacterium]|nr:3-isopropylmalate dehydratase small subunit [Candidatus Omnitrophota bacterium]MBU1928517.1 3-isopropylmalate dehydratase small subunit [Candidatus Omnitrophota bacterium]MBU2034710.1 3-isopropylmalate dehydratase small subunit [Candidatus Omnitrophota bacterium]MBU2221722.1 3-isopropylmalate dehydratase small subunit [Candidatus Omnitrophota bacterium]MBU2257828.1 3-isopropylmalate dehydratase small subunit [Candidatus Omnitrophota bacterium]
MIIKGRVHKFADDINTDDIIAAKYLVSTDAKELGGHCMESIRPDFLSKVKPGDIIVAGKNFGCGSSREHAPMAVKGCGVSAVLAKSFAAIFFRNAINIGLPFLELEEVNKINDGDEIEIDLTSGIIRNLTKAEDYQTQAFPEFLQDIVKNKGLINWVTSRKKEGHPSS